MTKHYPPAEISNNTDWDNLASGFWRIWVDFKGAS
jgi:hypothetical protein